MTIRLANQAFTYGIRLNDIQRRLEYARNPSANLLPEEEAVLRALGVDEEMESRLRPYIPDFFEALPDCQSDTSLHLHKQCEVPYYVLWSTLFAERLDTTKRKYERDASTKPMTDLNMAMTDATVDSFQKRPSKIDSVFTLIVNNANYLSRTKENAYVNDIFTLMIQT